MKRGECVYNKHILCELYPDGTTTCNNLRCGWNPPVIKARIDEIRTGGLTHLSLAAETITEESTKEIES